MYFQYGGYRHPAAEVILASISRSTEYSPRGLPLISKVSWTISGVIQGTSLSDLTSKLAALEAAYAKQGQSAGLFLTGGTPTTHQLPNGTAIGGVRSSGVSYPSGEGVEYVTSRTYSVTLEADYEFTGNELLEFNETLSFQGTCGPRYVYLPTLNGPPEKQIVQQKTTMTATQSGSAMGYRARPSPPPPLWPKDEHEESRRIDKTSPRVIAGKSRDFGISWSYTFESSSPLNGQPRTQ